MTPEAMMSAPATRNRRPCAADSQTPQPKAITSRLYTAASATHRGLVGAPIAESSLMVCDAELYPSHRIATKATMAA